MMLTPIDIQKKDFEVKFRGYDTDEVDLFLDMLARDYEKLYKDNIEMKDKISVLTEAVDNYKSMETTLRNSIILAQKASDEIRKDAEMQAQTIIKDANSTANEITAKAREESAKIQGTIEALKTELSSYKTQIKLLCAGITEMIERD